MIIWIASYPKSGNTWIRSIISALLYSNDGVFNFKLLNKIDQFPEKKYFKDSVKNFSNFNEIKKNWILEQDKINLDNKIKFFKTHSAYWKAYNTQFTDEENTLGVINIVRDPRNIITSVLNHFSKENYSEASKFMRNSAQQIWDEKNNDERFMTIISSWANHYNSWKKFRKNNLLVYYEKLLSDPIEEFNKICNFLNKIANFNFEKGKILKAIEKCNFNNLQKIENESGFVEAPLDISGSKKKFFNLGPQNDWRKILDKKTLKNIENSFENEMKELGYLE